MLSCENKINILKRYEYIRFYLALILLLITSFSFAQDSPRVSKSFKDDYEATVRDVHPGDVFNIDIIVRGFHQYTSELIPFDAVLLIDRSSSMDGDKIDQAKAAAKTFIELAKLLSPSAVGGQIKIGLVTFEDEGETVREITDNYDQLLEDVDDISTPFINFGGNTNMADGIYDTQYLFNSSTSQVKVVLLLSDGRPTPDTDAQSQFIYYTLTPDAIDSDIRYYTIGLGADPASGVLIPLADRTGGEYYSVPDPEDLVSIYIEIFNNVTHTIIANNIILKERVDINKVEIIPDSLVLSDPWPIEPSDWELSNFISTGSIDIFVGRLSSSGSRHVNFKVRTKNCLNPDSDQDSVSISPNIDTFLTFYIGQVPGEFHATQEPITCHKPPGLRIFKNFDHNENEVILTLKSMYLENENIDNTIKNIKIFEIPSIQYQYQHPYSTPRTNKFFPGEIVDLLFWQIPSLAPQEEREIRFNVNLRAYMPRDSNPLRINAVQKEEVSSYATFIKPGGTSDKVSLPQAYNSVPALETLAGRPDLHIRPAHQGSEFRAGIPESDPNDTEYLKQNAGTLPSNWPFYPKFFKGSETPDIWIDSKANGYVNRWGPRDNHNVIQDINDHIANAIFSPPQGWFSGIRGQGDLFHRNKENRIHIHIKNTGAKSSRPLSNGLILKAFNYQSNRWEEIQRINIPSLESPGRGSTSILSTVIPENTIATPFLNNIPKPSGGIWNNAWIAELRVELVARDIEKHTNNNFSSERFIVVP